MIPLSSASPVGPSSKAGTFLQSRNALKPLHLQPGLAFTSLVRDKSLSSHLVSPEIWPPEYVDRRLDNRMVHPQAVIDSINCIRPSGQLVLLLQKNQQFPHYPHELSQSIDEKTWQSRMQDLEKALNRYWSWVTKTLFVSAFIISITVPWPLIAAITRYMQNDDSDNYYGDISVGSSLYPSTSSRSASKATSSSANPSSTASDVASATITSAARLLARANDAAKTSSIASQPWSDSDSYGGFAGDGYWGDNYTTGMRWTAIGILLGVLVLAWLPWVYVTIRNHIGIKKLIENWNAEDSQLGPSRSLEWSLNKAPPFSNAKILLVRLPPNSHQAPSSFHHAAYPPTYGFKRPTSLPDYDEESAVGMPPGVIVIEKSAFAPPAGYAGSTDSTSPRRFTVIDDDDDEAIKSSRLPADNDIAGSWATYNSDATTIRGQGPRELGDLDVESVRSHRRSVSTSSISSSKRQSRSKRRSVPESLSQDWEQSPEVDEAATPRIRVTRASKASSFASRRSSQQGYLANDQSFDGSGRLP